MNRRRVILISLMIVIPFIALLAIRFLAGEKEPQYQDRRLTYWLQLARNPAFDQRKQADAEAAVRSIGTDALPLLLRWVNYAPAQWRIRLSSSAKKLPFSDLRNGLQSWLTERDKRRFDLAIKGFEILGPLAGSALPRLNEIAADKKTRFGPAIFRTAAYIELWIKMEQRRAPPVQWE